MWLDYKAEVEGMSGDTLIYSASNSTYISGVDTANGDDESITTFVKLDDDIIEVIKNEVEESDWNF
jgi:hypothetical protein